MSDYLFHRFYQDAKGADWPSDIDNYADLLKLPKWIQSECKDDYNVDAKLSEIEDQQHWRKLAGPSIAYRKDDVIFVPVYKCGSSYYTKWLIHQGWTTVNIWDIDLTQLSAIGVIMHPLTRRLKGITDRLCAAWNKDYDAVIKSMTDHNFRSFISKISIFNDHSFPYTMLYGEKINQIHWIPMELFSINEINDQIVDFCKKFNVDLAFSEDYYKDSTLVYQGFYKNKSNPLKLKIYNMIKDDWMNDPGSLVETYMLFADDLKFYHELLRKHKKVINEQD